MHKSNVVSRWKDNPSIKNFTGKDNQIRYKRLSMKFKQIIQMINGRTFLLLILSLTLLYLMFLNISDSLSTSDEQLQKFRYRTRIARRNKQPILFEKAQHRNQTHKISENVIAYLVASFSGELRLAWNPYPRLRERVAQLDERLNDSYVTDVVIFHTGYPFRSEVLEILETTRRHVQFVNIDHIFYRFSPGFKPHITDPNWSQKGKWNYHHMCYFWFKQIFEIDIIQGYKYMMRLDDDSQILDKWPNVFNLMTERQAVYMANKREVDFEYVLPGLKLIRNLTTAHIAKNNITVQNPDLFADFFNHTIEVPNFWNNIEIIDLSFMRQKPVLDFIQAVDESQGIFLYRWGDAPLRYVMLALFVNATQILHRDKLGLNYCHPC